MLKKGDIFIIIAVLVVSISYILINNTKTVNNDFIATIKHKGKIIKEIDLNKVEKPYNITVEYSYKNIIRVEKGKIRFLNSNCPNNTCVSHGWLDDNNDISVCLPNEVSITVKSSNKKSLDGVSY